MRQEHLEIFKRYADNGNKPWIELGVYKGESLKQMCQLCPHRTIYGVDSFQGMADSTKKDISDGVDQYPKGRMAFSLPLVQLNLKDCSNARFIKGFVPDVLEQVGNNCKSFSLAHVDMDQYWPTREALVWLQDKCDVIICDDYFPDKKILASAAINEWLKASGHKIKEVVNTKAVIELRKP